MTLGLYRPRSSEDDSLQFEFEAMLWDGTAQCAQELHEWTEGMFVYEDGWAGLITYTGVTHIRAMPGELIAQEADGSAFIIVGPVSFGQTFEAVQA